jgi:SAM-dependent methyltransferase
MTLRAAFKTLRRRVKGLLEPIDSSGSRERNAAGKVASRWSRLASDAFVQDLERVSWTGIPQVHLNHNYQITGSRDIYWIDWMRERFFPDGAAGDTLSLGCGAGHLDRIFKQHGFKFRSFTGIDISAEAVERARTLAHEVHLAETILYTAADLNQVALPASSFDFIYFFQSLHHIEALEYVLSQCEQALRSGGLLLVNEFVGPSRFQWTSRQLALANQVLTLLPEQLRRDLQRGGLKKEVIRPTVRHMERHDPSESVRSAEIERLMKERFEIIGEWNWGGTLNHLVFQDIAANFDPADACQRAIIELLIHHENVLIQEGVLPSDFKVFLARRKP